jgi:membrane associated rhomboid family serine protease
VIPLGDRPRRRQLPWLTGLLAAALLAAFVWLLRLPPEELPGRLATLALVPARLAPLLGGDLAAAPEMARLWSSQLLHGGLLHLLGNLLFLWVFGRGVEARLGAARYLPFVLLTGGLAGLVHTLVDPASTVPVIGASGAISGILGAYLVLFPRGRIETLVLLVIWPLRVEVPAAVWLLVWLALQLLAGARGLLGEAAAAGGVAWWAHVGGFAAGLLLARPLARLSRRR